MVFVRNIQVLPSQRPQKLIRKIVDYFEGSQFVPFKHEFRAGWHWLTMLVSQKFPPKEGIKLSEIMIAGSIERNIDD